jgi:hypothetical protein
MVRFNQPTPRRRFRSRLLHGQLLRPPLLGAWQRGPKAAVGVLVLGLALFVLGLWTVGELPPLKSPDADPDTQGPAKLGLTTYPGLLLAVFAVLHWPARAEKHSVSPN